jgi:hypothetical protein
VGAAVMPPLLTWLLLEESESFTDAQNFGIAALTFIALALAETVVGLQELRVEHRERQRIAAARNELEADLVSIRDSCHAEGESLIAKYCRRAVGELRHDIETAIGSSEIHVDERSLFLTDFVVDGLRGRPEDLVRLIHRFTDNHIIVRAHELEWVRKVDEKVRERRITTVRRLFVFDSEDQLRELVSRSLIAAHLQDRRYTCRVIRSDYLEDLLTDHQIPVQVRDFGIYGRYTAFVSTAYTDEGLQGSYKVQSGEIDHYINAFDACWDSAVAFEPELDDAEGLPRSMREFLQSVRRWGEGRSDSAESARLA